MSIHMFRGFIGRGAMSLTDLETAIDTWLQQNARWEADHITHQLHERNTATDGTGEVYYTVDVRFLEEDTKANLTQKFEDKLVNKVDWYRLGYHSCTHDESNGGPCLWDDRLEWTDKDVTIPNGIPSIDISS
ncbi:hypothetical protein [Natronosalvus rutilus]|uniref:Uncharacterized protein n=1 Tax=Natronosalvus rutilus TaxID=2953753 RepID=A0A9E7SSN4_9EURY|nr:hypothetical protein [Natronosalvus rutilus]UTF52749.1 hypothetical protein NGM29_13280 [Natronosalvus rutilus]